MEIELTWDGPYKLSDFMSDGELRKHYDYPGVYLWLEDYGDDSRISYVGRATGKPTLARRQMQHYAYTVSGLYSIPREFRRNRTEWIPDWTKPDVAGVLLDKEKYLELIDDAFRYSSIIDVYLFRALNGENVHALERILLYSLQPTGTKWGTLTKPNPELKLIHRAPEALAAVMRKNNY